MVTVKHVINAHGCLQAGIVSKRAFSHYSSFLQNKDIAKNKKTTKTLWDLGSGGRVDYWVFTVHGFLRNLL